MKCPSCSYNNLSSAAVCKSCGSSLRFGDEIFKPERDSHKCYYLHDGIQCPAVGVMSPDVGSGEMDPKKVKPPRMYCEPHFWAMQVGDLSKCRLILEDYLGNGIPKSKQNWIEEHHKKLDRQYGPSKPFFATNRIAMPSEIRQQLEGFLGKMHTNIQQREPGCDDE